MHNYYKTLGVNNTASAQEIKSAYRSLAKKFHPDKNSTAAAEALFKEINKAYQVLADPDKRADYDLLFSPKENDTMGQDFGRPAFSEETKKQGRYFVIGLIVLVVVVPILLLRFSSVYNYKRGLDFYEAGDIGNSLIYFQKSVTELGARKKEASLKAIAICYNKGLISQGIAFAQNGSRYLFNTTNKGNLSYREGLGWEMLKRYSEADQAFRKALELGYNEDSVFIHLGMMHGFDLENYEEALIHFNYLIDESELLNFRLQRGITLENLGDHTSAIEDLSWFTKTFQEDATGHFFLGVSLVANGDTVMACKSFEKARELGLSESDNYLKLYCK